MCVLGGGDGERERERELSSIGRKLHRAQTFETLLRWQDGKKVPGTGKTVGKVPSRQGLTPGGGQATIHGLFAKKARKS